MREENVTRLRGEALSQMNILFTTLNATQEAKANYIQSSLLCHDNLFYQPNGLLYD